MPNFNPIPILILLGGYDLEMVEIRKLLLVSGFVEISHPSEIKNKNCFADKKLAWGASITDYQEFLREGDDTKIYGIELTEPEGWIRPKNYIPIDHHNNYPPEPTALEQVCALLNYKPVNAEQERRFALVKANDTGHIKGMKAIGATAEEILQIRLEDRKAQGVTEADEVEAAKEITNATNENRVTIIYSTIRHFSAITDMIETDRLLVYSDTELSYYGIGANSFIKDAFADLVKEKKAYYGGSGDGYFGVASGVLSKKELEAIKNKIIEMNSPVSKHIFLFPFRWDYKPPKIAIEAVNLKERLNIGSFINFLKVDDKWQRSTFYETDPLEYYNDATYFYEYVRNSIYTFDEKEPPVHNFEYKISCGDAVYEINIEKDTEKKEIFIYRLRVNKILLNIYETGVAILSFHLSNFDHSHTKEDILRINDYGRRLYPQFLDTATDKNSKDSELIIAARKAFLAKSIKIYIEECNPFFREEFEQFKDVKRIENLIREKRGRLPNMPESVTKLIGTNFRTLNNIDEEEEIIIRPIMDDRMFVVCWYGNKKEVQYLQHDIFDNEYGYLKHERNDFWTKFIFVDNTSNTIQSRMLRKKLVEKNTYDRWIDWNTLYGICRYSVVCLTDREWFAVNHISNHVAGRYFEFIQLALVQRACIIKFSDETTMLAGCKEKKLISGAEFLHIAYMRFINRLNFSEVTSQEQGIEMYKMLMESMEIDRDIKTLNSEIDELHQFVSMKEQDTATKEATWLNILAVIFLPATFFVSILGISLFDKNNLVLDISSPFSRPAFDYLVATFLILLIPSYYYRKKIFERIKRHL